MSERQSHFMGTLLSARQGCGQPRTCWPLVGGCRCALAQAAAQAAGGLGLSARNLPSWPLHLACACAHLGLATPLEPPPTHLLCLLSALLFAPLCVCGICV